MPRTLDLSGLADPHGWFADPEEFLVFVNNYVRSHKNRLDKLWLYYTDEEMRLCIETKGTENGRNIVTGQEIGLPYRISGLNYFRNHWSVSPSSSDEAKLDLARKEPVTENECGWRADTFVDWLHGERDGTPRASLESEAESEELQKQIIDLLTAVAEGQSEPDWLRQWATQSAVFGFVDVDVRLKEGVEVVREVSKDADGKPVQDAKGNPVLSGPVLSVTWEGEVVAEGDFDTFGKMLDWHIATPQSVVPLVNPLDVAELWGWALAYNTIKRPFSAAAQNKPFAKSKAESTPWLEVITPEVHRVFMKGDDGWEMVSSVLVLSDGLPVVHKQHKPVRGAYAGTGVIGPLIPMQDELNIRLSDRSNKITYQSHQQYLGKRVDDFENKPIGPSVMWSVDDAEASIEAIGGNTSDPGADKHIDDVRDGMSRISCIPPIAAGDVKDQLGNLTSGTALRVVLRGLLARLSAQRTVDNRAISQIARITLDIADAIGVLPTEPEDRGVVATWTKTIELDESERLDNSIRKQALGVPREVIWREDLGADDEQIAEWTQAANDQAARDAASMTFPKNDNEDEIT